MSIATFRRVFRSRSLLGLLRLFCFFSVLGIFGSPLLVRSARAQGERYIENAGRKLLQSLGPLMIGEPQELNVNGQRVFVASNITTLGAREAIDRFERYCREHSGGLRQAIGELPGTFRGEKLPDELRDPSRWMTSRSSVEGDDFGQITCFARSGSTSFFDFVNRLGKFFETGEVSALGDMRYAVARRTEGGTTQVLAIWTEGSFNLFDMVPDAGDARGTDSARAPRFPGSRRLLSAEIPNRPHSFRVYEVSAQPEHVLAHYDLALMVRGYFAESSWLENEDDTQATALPSYARAYSKDGNLFIVSAILEPAFEKTTQISIVEIGGGTARADLSQTLF